MVDSPTHANPPGGFEEADCDVENEFSDLRISEDGPNLNNGPPKFSLAAAKERRRQAERDAQLLANRIALLKQEEMKAWKKIEETRQKAQQMMEMRLRQEEKQKDRERQFREKYRYIKEAQIENLKRRERAAETRELAKHKAEVQKRADAQRVKQLQQHNFQERIKYEDELREYNILKKKNIKQQHEENRKKREDEKNRRLRGIHEEYEQRVSREELLRVNAETVVTKLEQEELELIQRLQNTQILQQDASQQLNTALYGPPPKKSSPEKNKI